MKAKKIYHYHINTDDVKNMNEVGEYMMSSRRPLELGDYVVLEVYPPTPDEPTIEQMMWSQENPPECCVLGKVSRFTEDRDGVFFMIVSKQREDKNG